MVPCDKIPARGEGTRRDRRSASGLITPSLEEMAHVASEMQRQGFDVPLLIGGATTSAPTPRSRSRRTTRRRWSMCRMPRAPSASYQAAVDRPRRRLQGRGRRRLREGARPAREQEGRDAGPARTRRAPTRCRSGTPVQPKKTGVTVFRRTSTSRRPRRVHRLGSVLPDLGSRRRLPEDPDDEKVGEAARNVFEDGQAMLGS